jgi:predicted signal transduction protein with EAL and GGDEF domain
VIHPDDCLAVEQEVEARVERAEPFTLEYRIVTADGELRWVHEQGQAVFGPEDQVLSLDGAIFDIGERKRLEAELEHLAYHDSLTGLPNRRSLMAALEATRACRWAARLAWQCWRLSRASGPTGCAPTASPPPQRSPRATTSPT